MKSYFGSFKKEESNVLTDQIATRLAELAGPYSEELNRLITKQDYAGLVGFELSYNFDWDPLALFCARQCLALYQKRADLKLGIDKSQVALEKFIESEQACKESNIRISRSREDGATMPRLVARVIFTAQQKISRILGDVPNLDDLQFAYGPGANTNVRKTTSARWKLSAKPACSASMAGMAGAILAQVPAYTKLHSWESETSWFTEVEIQAGELMFVPKNAKTDRSIMVEPSLNSLAQKGYGRFIRDRLLKSGVNLLDQSINTERARIGSLNNSLATIDLSSASDTISKELVSELLPHDWYVALASIRTGSVECKRYSYSVPKLEKFSSMGNGFTFELESLIFYALTVAVCHCCGVKPNVTVYGDDIICPPEIVPSLTEVFTWCGFSINASKSYTSGPFRESCGKDFYNGINVRPFYQRELWSWATLTAFHNFLVRSGWSVLLPDMLEYALKDRPDLFRNYGPEGFGDGHLLGDWSPVPYRRERGWGGYTFQTYIRQALRVKGMCRGDFAIPEYSVYLRMSASMPYNRYTVRGDSANEKLISVYTLGR